MFSAQVVTNSNWHGLIFIVTFFFFNYWLGIIPNETKQLISNFDRRNEVSWIVATNQTEKYHAMNWNCANLYLDESDYAGDMETEVDVDYPEDDLQYDEVDDEIDRPVDDEGNFYP